MALGHDHAVSIRDRWMVDWTDVHGDEGLRAPTRGIGHPVGEPCGSDEGVRRCEANNCSGDLGGADARLRHGSQVQTVVLGVGVVRQYGDRGIRAFVDRGVVGCGSWCTVRHHRGRSVLADLGPGLRRPRHRDDGRPRRIGGFRCRVSVWTRNDATEKRGDAERQATHRRADHRWDRDATERALREQRQRPHGEAEASERDAQERTHDLRIELGSRASGDLSSSGLRIDRRLVRASRSDHVEHVCH